MSNIILLYERNAPSVELLKRVLETWNSVCDANAEFRFLRDGQASEDDLNWCDVLIIARGMTPYERDFCLAANKAGKFTVLNIDDDMLNPPTNYVMSNVRKRALLTIIRECGALLMSNGHLMQKYAAINRNHRTAYMDVPVDKDRIHLHKEGNSIVKIVYAAGGDHAPLFEEYILPVLNEVVSACKNAFEITCIGNFPNTDGISLSVPIKKIATLPYQEYEKFMAESNFDIGLAPVYDTEFCHCKYFNKFLSYAKYGIVGVFTDCEPYVSVVKNGVNGVLCQNTAEAWKNALISAIDNTELMSEMRANAYATLGERFTPQRVANELAKALPELFEHKQSASQARWNFRFAALKKRCFVVQNTAYLFLKGVKTNGLSKTLEKAKTHKSNVKGY